MYCRLSIIDDFTVRRMYCMPVLLMSRGDQESKALLRRAIEARYGFGAPVLESLKLQLKGRARTKVGPVTTWVPLEVSAYFKFGFAARWDYTARPAGIAVNSGAETFDGTICRRQQGSEPVVVIDNPEQAASMRARLWALGATLLTPLSEHFVELKLIDERTFSATNRESDVTTRLHLGDNDTLEYSETTCLNPATDNMETYRVWLSDGQRMIGDLMLPSKLGISWENQPEVELTPTGAKSNLPVTDSIFRIEGS